MLTGRANLTSCAVNGIIYAIGGNTFGSDSSANEAYDPATDTWTRKKDMPTARDTMSASVVNGIIYGIGGRLGPSDSWVARSTVEAYDPATDTWTKKADMPTARSFPSTCVVNGKIYVFGGYSGNSAVEIYDPATDTWVKKANMPFMRNDLSICPVDGIIYTFGGFNASWTAVNEVYAYDPVTDTWTRKPDMTTVRGFLSTSVVNSKVYVIGGSIDADHATPLTNGVVEEYNPLKAVMSLSVDAKEKSATFWGKIKATS